MVNEETDFVLHKKAPVADARRAFFTVFDQGPYVCSGRLMVNSLVGNKILIY